MFGIEIEPIDREKLIELLLNVPELETSRGCKQILVEANLENFTSRISFDGSARSIVNDIVYILSKHGFINSNETALGCFLVTVKKYTGMQQQAFLDQLLIKYQKKSNESKNRDSGSKAGVYDPPRLYEVLDPNNFDLKELIKSCWNELDDKQGLVGLAVPYNEDPFPRYFCKRLKDRLDKKDIFLKEPLTLDYRTPVVLAVNRIIKYKELLKKGDVICPVRVAVSDINSINQFWQKVSDEFQENFKHCLILVILSSESYSDFLESNVIHLDSPNFTKWDVDEWVTDVTKALKWGEEEREVKKKWKKKIIGEDIQTNRLDTRSVYDNLLSTIELFKENVEQNLTPKDFSNALDRMIEAYVQTLC